MPVSRWSECDPITLTATRTLELRSRTSHQCDNNEVESKDCGTGKDGGRPKEGRNKNKRKGKGHKNKLHKKGTVE